MATPTLPSGRMHRKPRTRVRSSVRPGEWGPDCFSNVIPVENGCILRPLSPWPWNPPDFHRVMRSLYYGWWIVIAASCNLFVCAGIGFFSFPVFLKFIEADSHWGRDALSNAGALAALAAGFATPAIGYALDRYRAQIVMIPGAVLLSASFLLLSRSDSLVQMYALFVAMGIGMAATTGLPCQTLISRWFEEKRGRAMGAITVAAGMGGMFWMPVTTRLIEATGWRNAYWVLGTVIAAVSLPVIGLILRSSPQSMGLAVEGRGNEARLAETLKSRAAGAGGAGPDCTTAEAMGTVGFWIIFCASFLGPFAASGFGLHVVSFLSDSGLSSGGASGVWSAVIGTSIGGTFLFGFLSERFQKRYLCSAAHFTRSLSLLFLVLFALERVPRVAAISQFIILYGLAMGCMNVAGPLLLSETFGVKAFGKLMGLMGIPVTLGMALGQFLSGWLFHLQNNYHIAFSAFVLAYLLSGISLIFVKPTFLLSGPSRLSDRTSNR